MIVIVPKVLNRPKIDYLQIDGGHNTDPYD